MAEGSVEPIPGRGFHVSREEFEELIDAAWQELPPQIRHRLGNVLISAADDEQERIHRNLYGLYEGVPEPNNLGQFPARITLWQRTMEHDFPSRDLLAAQVRQTLFHEIGHHFGMSEGEVRRATYGEGYAWPDWLLAEDEDARPRDPRQSMLVLLLLVPALGLYLAWKRELWAPREVAWASALTGLATLALLFAVGPIALITLVVPGLSVPAGIIAAGCLGWTYWREATPTS